MIIRKAKVEDAKSMVEINVNTWKVAYKGLLPDEILDNRNVTEKRIEHSQEAIKTKDKIHFVAEENGEIVGFLTGGDSRDETVPVDFEVYALYVSPLMQRKGIGQALLDAFMKEINYAPFYLYALKSNQNARQFYIKNGGMELPEFEKELPEKYNNALESLFMFNL